MKKEGSDLKIMEEMERKKLQDRYIRFDWAIKRLLRRKRRQPGKRRRQVQPRRHQSLEQ